MTTPDARARFFWQPGDLQLVDAPTAATFTSAGALKAWLTRDRGKGEGDVTKFFTAEEFGALSPQLRPQTPAEWDASPKEKAAAKRLAKQKMLDVPQPTPEKIAKNLAMLERAKIEGRPGGDQRGSSPVRRARGEALFAEFGGLEKGYVPCVHCGLKVSPGGRGGYAHMQQDKILVTKEGGNYGTPTHFENLVPSCDGSNASRNDAPTIVRPKWETTATLAALAKAKAAAPRLFIKSGGKAKAHAKAKANPKRARKPHAIAASAGLAGMVVRGRVLAFPIGWNDPDRADDGLTPVVGLYGVRNVETLWGTTYEQHLVGGIPVDPDTVKPYAEPVVASAGEFTRAGALKAWETRDRGEADHPALKPSTFKPKPPAGATHDLTTKAGIKKAFTMVGDQYETKVLSVNPSLGGFVVRVQLNNRAGHKIGEASREVGIRGGTEAYHMNFTLDDGVQGRGVGSQFLRDSVEMYAAAGIKRIGVDATSSGHAGSWAGAGKMNGAYTWARLGFTPDDPGKIATKMTERANKLLNTATERRAWMLKTATALRDKTMTIQEMAATRFGKDYLTGAQGEVNWIGHLDVETALTASAGVAITTATVDYDAWEACELGENPWPDPVPT